jgi:hypothetical protein
MNCGARAGSPWGANKSGSVNLTGGWIEYDQDTGKADHCRRPADHADLVGEDDARQRDNKDDPQEADCTCLGKRQIGNGVERRHQRDERNHYAQHMEADAARHQDSAARLDDERQKHCRLTDRTYQQDLPYRNGQRQFLHRRHHRCIGKARQHHQRGADDIAAIQPGPAFENFRQEARCYQMNTPNRILRDPTGEIAMERNADPASIG